MFCKNCGNQMDPNAAVCVKCGVSKGMGFQFCPNCGKPTIPSFITCYTYPKMPYFQALSPFSIFLLHNLLHNQQGFCHHFNFFSLLIFGYINI